MWPRILASVISYAPSDLNRLMVLGRGPRILAVTSLYIFQGYLNML